ncbi:hypothetical protein [Ruminococcus sp.]|uniref:hypothetical protein n=1 Tax=Ruminococcus sp. TaxID=41978 RepID=UPI0025FB997E|nr:hypothetical protein [Ruminococcus sp.]
MKDDLDLLFSNKDDDIERISAKYQAVGKKKKEQIYKISKRKYDILKSREMTDDDFKVEASGVERYKRPRIYSAICAAAAAFVLVGGISGAYLYSKANKLPRVSESTSSSVYVEPTTSEDKFSNEKDLVVNELADDLEHIMKAQSLGSGSADHSSSVNFYADTYDQEKDSFINKAKSYYRVMDEKINTYEKLDQLLKSSFGFKIRDYFEGGDLSHVEDGYNFKDDSMANKYLKTFIIYKNSVYALSDCAFNESISRDIFPDRYNFSNYELVSSVFSEDTSGFEGEFTHYLMYSSYTDEATDSLVCHRIYQRKDGVLVYADFLIKEIQNTWKIADYSVLDEDEWKHREIERENNNTESTTVTEEEDAEDFAELQLHELKVFESESEANAYVDAVREKYLNERPKFRKVDTEKYSQQIFNARNFSEYNTLENKSYLYHMMINSKFYIDTAEGKAESYLGTYEFCIDNPGRKYYSYSDEKNGYDGNRTNNRYKLYTDNNMTGYTDLNNGRSETDKLDEEAMLWYEANIPDNDMVVAYKTDNGLTYVPGPYSYTPISFDYILIPGFFSDSSLCDFSTWNIDNTAVLFGRQCARVVMKTADATASIYVDLRTGMTMKYYIKRNGDDDEYVNITELTVNEPVNVPEYDGT